MNICQHCGTAYLPVTNKGRRFYCSTKCNKSAWVSRNAEAEAIRQSTTKQYELITSSWRRYYQRLVGKRGRSKTLALDDVLALHEQQNGICALTGLSMTKNLEVGVICHTNASLDRVVAGGEYVIANIRLVCSAVNKFRADLGTEEFIDMCRRVAEHADQRKAA
jgi:hypothetical protein